MLIRDAAVHLRDASVRRGPVPHQVLRILGAGFHAPPSKDRGDLPSPGAFAAGCGSMALDRDEGGRHFHDVRNIEAHGELFSKRCHTASVSTEPCTTGYESFGRHEFRHMPSFIGKSWAKLMALCRASRNRFVFLHPSILWANQKSMKLARTGLRLGSGPGILKAVPCGTAFLSSRGRTQPYHKTVYLFYICK